MNKQLIYNAIRTPDGTLLESFDRHDYKSYTDANGFMYMVDGGLNYSRRILNPSAPAEDLSLYTDDPHELIRQRFSWGTHGKDGKQPFKRVKLKDMDTDHIVAILLTQTHIPDFMVELFENELCFRGEYDAYRD